MSIPEYGLAGPDAFIKDINLESRKVSHHAHKISCNKLNVRHVCPKGSSFLPRPKLICSSYLDLKKPQPTTGPGFLSPPFPNVD